MRDMAGSACAPERKNLDRIRRAFGEAMLITCGKDKFVLADLIRTKFVLADLIRTKFVLADSTILAGSSPRSCSKSGAGR